MPHRWQTFVACAALAAVVVPSATARAQGAGDEMSSDDAPPEKYERRRRYERYTPHRYRTWGYLGAMIPSGYEGQGGMFTTGLTRSIPHRDYVHASFGVEGGAGVFNARAAKNPGFDAEPGVFFRAGGFAGLEIGPSDDFACRFGVGMGALLPAFDSTSDALGLSEPSLYVRPVLGVDFMLRGPHVLSLEVEHMLTRSVRVEANEVSLRAISINVGYTYLFDW